MTFEAKIQYNNNNALNITFLLTTNKKYCCIVWIINPYECILHSPAFTRTKRRKCLRWLKPHKPPRLHITCTSIYAKRILKHKMLFLNKNSTMKTKFTELVGANCSENIE